MVSRIRERILPGDRGRHRTVSLITSQRFTTPVRPYVTVISPAFGDCPSINNFYYSIHPIIPRNAPGFRGHFPLFQ